MHHRRGRLRRGGGGTAQSADRTGESWGCDCGGFLAEPLPLFPLSPIPSPAEGRGGSNQTHPSSKNALTLSAASAEFSCMKQCPPGSDSTVTMGLRPASCSADWRTKG